MNHKLSQQITIKLSTNSIRQSPNIILKINFETNEEMSLDWKQKSRIEENCQPDVEVEKLFRVESANLDWARSGARSVVGIFGLDFLPRVRG